MYMLTVIVQRFAASLLDLINNQSLVNQRGVLKWINYSATKTLFYSNFYPFYSGRQKNDTYIKYPYFWYFYL